MLHETVVDFNFWERLSAIDERIAKRVAALGCVHCGGLWLVKTRLSRKH